MNLYYDKRSFSTATATTAANGFPATNAIFESLERPWNATGAGATDWTGTFAAPLGVHSLFVHDVNFASATVFKSADGVTFVSVGTLTTYADRLGRRRGRITINDATVKAIRVTIAAGTPADGLTFWRMGSVYPFGTAQTPTGQPDYPVSSRPSRPRTVVQLPNGQAAVATTGQAFDRLTLTFLRKYQESVDDLIQRASAGTILVDLALTSYPEQLWPVRCIEQDLGEDFPRPLNSTLTVPLIEVV